MDKKFWGKIWSHQAIATPVIWLTFFLSGVIGVLWTFNCTINMTGSMPIGVWRVSPVTLPLESLRHKAVLFCPPDTAIFRWARSLGALFRGRCPGDYTPLLKEVVGLPGDLIEIHDAHVFLNGRKLPRSKILTTLPTKIFWEKEIIPKGSLWVMGTESEASFDSRYFGVVNVSNVLGVSQPWLLGEAFGIW